MELCQTVFFDAGYFLSDGGGGGACGRGSLDGGTMFLSRM